MQTHAEPDVPWTITLRRTYDGAEVSIPQGIVYHSPTGFEWGYGGSGPADLALNVLDLWLPRDSRKDVKFDKHHVKASVAECYQDFKREVIATIPEDGGTLNRHEVLHWYILWLLRKVQTQLDERT